MALKSKSLTVRIYVDDIENYEAACKRISFPQGQTPFQDNTNKRGKILSKYYDGFIDNLSVNLLETDQQTAKFACKTYESGQVLQSINIFKKQNAMGSAINAYDQILKSKCSVVLTRTRNSFDNKSTKKRLKKPTTTVSIKDDPKLCSKCFVILERDTFNHDNTQASGNKLNEAKLRAEVDIDPKLSSKCNVILHRIKGDVSMLHDDLNKKSTIIIGNTPNKARRVTSIEDQKLNNKSNILLQSQIDNIISENLKKGSANVLQNILRECNIGATRNIKLHENEHINEGTKSKGVGSRKHALVTKVISGQATEILYKNNESSPILVKNLRKQKRKNYVESPNESTQSTYDVRQRYADVERQPKVPIYRQIHLDLPVQKKEELYEFHFDPKEENINKRRRTRRSSTYDKTMQEVLHNIMKKYENKNKVKAVKQDKRKKVTLNKMGEEKIKVGINAHLKHVGQLPIMEEAHINNQLNPDTVWNNQGSYYHLNNAFTGSELNTRQVGQLPQGEVVHIENQLILNTFMNENNHSNLDNPSQSHTNQNQEINIFSHNDLDNSPDLHINENKEIGIINYHNNIDNSSPEHIQENLGVNIISNILLHSPSGDSSRSESPIFLDYRRPCANSTMLSPWRFDLAPGLPKIKNFIIKPTALPSTSQDAILSYNEVEHFETDCTFKSKAQSEGNPKIQTNILTYLNSTDASHKKATSCNNQNSALNSSNSVKRKSYSRRNILVPFNDNQDALSLSVGNEPNITLFGFDEDELFEDKENYPIAKDKPFRMSVNALKRKKLFEAPEMLSENLQVLENQESTPVVHQKAESKPDCQEEINAEDESFKPVLFEDLRTEPVVEPLRQYTGKKRQRCWFVDEDNKTKRPKKKDIRTKAEEEEAEKWAKRFNEMCEEIEKYELEIE